MQDEEDDPDEQLELLAEVAARLRKQRVEVARTIRALRAKRRTPEQIRAAVDRARAAVYRSILMRRRWQTRQQVH
jgi:hypothetical protein